MTDSTNSPVQAGASQPLPTRIILEQPQRTNWARWSSRLAWIGLGLSLLVIMSLMGSISSYYQTNPDINEKYHSLSKTATDKVAIITIDGAIMHSDGFVKWQIDRVREDEDVRAVVIRVDSPGGTVTGSHYIYHHLRRLAEEKNVPMVVSMGGMAASGGYYVSMAVADQPDAIFAEPTTWTGSIGVIIPHYDLSGLLARFDVKETSITSHRLKGMLSPTKEMTDEERAILQELVDNSFQDFLAIVKSGRPNLSDEKLKEVATGQVFTAKQAKEHGLVDGLGFVEDAISRAIELAGLAPTDSSQPNVRVVRYSKPAGLFDDLMFGPTAQGSGLDMATLVDLTAPRAYYLCSWLPTIASTRQ